MNHGPIWGRLLKKTRGRQSRATVPLRPDRSVYVQVVYRLLPDQDPDVAAKFSLSTRDGAAVLSLVSPLDYETKRLYEVVIEARDRAGPGDLKSAETTVIVKVKRLVAYKKILLEYSLFKRTLS